MDVLTSWYSLRRLKASLIPESLHRAPSAGTYSWKVAGSTGIPALFSKAIKNIPCFSFSVYCQGIPSLSRASTRTLQPWRTIQIRKSVIKRLKCKRRTQRYLKFGLVFLTLFWWDWTQERIINIVYCNMANTNNIEFACVSNLATIYFSRWKKVLAATASCNKQYYQQIKTINSKCVRKVGNNAWSSIAVVSKVILCLKLYSFSLHLGFRHQKDTLAFSSIGSEEH